AYDPAHHDCRQRIERAKDLMGLARRAQSGIPAACALLEACRALRTPGTPGTSYVADRLTELACTVTLEVPANPLWISDPDAPSPQAQHRLLDEYFTLFDHLSAIQERRDFVPPRMGVVLPFKPRRAA